MYYDHFGLDQAPFKITPNTDFFFGGGNRGPILEALIYAITSGEGIVKVTGEVGSGKTMLCNMLQARLPPHIETVYLAHPNVAPEEILHAIAFELQLGIGRGAPRIEVTHELQDHLLQRHAEGKRVVVFVEESQGMPLATLEEIRLLSNLETRNDKLLQIVLFGQPELDANLDRPNIRQLRERITHSFRLEPLTAGEVREYLMFRLRAAGYRGPDLFPPAVARAIARAARGLTRRVNVIADKTLLAAFSENTHTIRPKHVAAAVRDSEFGRQREARLRFRFARTSALLIAGAAIGVAAHALLTYGRGAGEGNSPRTGAGPVAATDTAVPAAATAPAPAMAAGPAPAPPEPASGQGDAEPDWVAQRLAATEEWLATAAENNYSIQLMVTDAEDQLKHHLNELAKFVEPNKVFLYRNVASRKASLTVLYGDFSGQGEAQLVLDNLPSSLKTNRPFLRTVRGIRTEVRRQPGS